MMIGDPHEQDYPAGRWLSQMHAGLEILTKNLLKSDISIEDIMSALTSYDQLSTDKVRQELRVRYGIEVNPLLPLDQSHEKILEALSKWANIIWRPCTESSLRTLYLKKIAEESPQALYETLGKFVSSHENEKTIFDSILAQFHLQLIDTAESEERNIEIGNVLTRISLALSKPDTWHEWVEYTDTLHALRRCNRSLIYAIGQFHRGSISPQLLQTSGEFLFYNTHADNAIKKHTELTIFDTNGHEGIRQRFKELDNKICEAHRNMIVSRLLLRRPPAGSKGSRVTDLTEMALLKHYASKTRLRISMRRILEKAGHALQTLKPCFMMGPLSVAQYLKPGSLKFDMVIMDEASQIRPEDALGAIARGAQLIVVGDPKQLPPTSFFDKINDEDPETEDEEFVTTGQESILEMVTPYFTPVRSLDWHYRSRHESLIAFSNNQFYNRRLLLFPSSTAKSDDLGIEYHYVDEGVCNSSVNEREAAEVVRGAIRELKRMNGKYTIGIVAMNVKQQVAIQDEWDRQLRELPDVLEMADRLDSEKGEPYFIKNLENVQGDERDIMILSMTYGPDSEGHQYQRFGPINMPKGWRRLNVLFTRARRKMIVYSSMRSGEIASGAESSRGRTALKNFIEYCETGKLVDQPVVTGREPANDFEIAVAEEVRNCGFRAIPQVGVSGYFIDIGVTHEAYPGEYLLGIECDGAPYHSAKSARDRDKLRQNILESMGWKIYRIWSTDWYRRNSSEKRRLISTLEKIKAKIAITDMEGVNKEEPTYIRLDREGKYSLKRRLLELRKIIEVEFPNTAPQKCLLADNIVDILNKQRPKSSNEFANAVPRQVRENIDHEQARKYLNTVFALIEDS